MSTQAGGKQREAVWILRFLTTELTHSSQWPLKILRTSSDENETEIGSATIDATEGPLVDLVRDEFSKDHSRLVLDIQGVKRIDSSGIGEIVVSSNYAYAAGSELVVVGLPLAIDKLIRSANIGWFFSYASLPEALQHFGSEPKVSP